MIRYRTDIDGLRALAILPVVLFHYGLKNSLPGGFIGVDIFFVISGFLITKNIHDDIHDHRFNIVDFYNRRIRRIFPALFTVLLFCFICSLIIEIPSEARATSRGIFGATFFFSNIMFFNMSDYFNQQMQNNPLLHTWSLSVEEQFYIIVPLFLSLIRSFRERTRSLMLFIAVALSFAASSYEVYHNAPAAFYLMQNRAWELLLGSVLAIGGIPKIANKRMLEMLGIAGLGLIVGSIVMLSKKSTFPGPGALAPCLGAVLILYSGATHQTLISRLLSVRPLRFIGLVSYSLYLWHWPIWVFVTHYFVPSGISTVMLLAISFAVAVISWRFIERPFRAKPFLLGPRGTVGVAGAVMALMSVLAFISVPLNHRLWHYTADATNILSYMDYKPTKMRRGTCFLETASDSFKIFDISTCLHISPTQKNYLLIGDSHAADLWYGLSTVNPTINFLQATASGCRPIMGIKGRRSCGDLMKYMFNDFIPQHHLYGIILSADWATREVDGAIKTAQAVAPYATHVIILGNSPVYDQPLPQILARSMLKHEPSMVAYHVEKKQQITDRDFSDRIIGSGIRYISVFSAVCPNSHCTTVSSSDVPIFFDTNHFTASGSILVAKKIDLSFPP